ncbi:hypothetical protein MTR_2g048200 [Medicago truncatula]|uniref:Uncharacterized protein n=1 Tax=Medicago truncatula TaxID=3880 RepID=G7ISW3_MEDTR|nr:hypothetical protein MTR_2g048200 [Medicago truncatula]
MGIRGPQPLTVFSHDEIFGIYPLASAFTLKFHYQVSHTKLGKFGSLKWLVYRKYDFSDWKHIISQRLIQHRNSAEHIPNMNTCNKLKIRLDKNQTIDRHLLEERIKEIARWR